jgi:aminoglycoside phosphotransferase (APT) family kinase protein
MTIDKADQVRDEDNLDKQKIIEYFQAKLPQYNLNNEQSFELLQFPSGASNLTYEIKLEQQSLILRTSPIGANIKSAHDMGREYQVLSRLINYFPYCPKPIAYADDEAIMGRPFDIM